MLEFKDIKSFEIPNAKKLSHEIWDINYKKMVKLKKDDSILDIIFSKFKLNQVLDESYMCKFIKLDNQLIGYISWKLEDDHLLLNKLYIKLEFQGKGYMTKSLEYIYRIAENMNCDKIIYIAVKETNIKDIRVYERFGFKKIDEFVFNLVNRCTMNDSVYQIKV